MPPEHLVMMECTTGTSSVEIAVVSSSSSASVGTSNATNKTVTFLPSEEFEVREVLCRSEISQEDRAKIWYSIEERKNMQTQIDHFTNSEKAMSYLLQGNVSDTVIPKGSSKQTPAFIIQETLKVQKKRKDKGKWKKKFSFSSSKTKTDEPDVEFETLLATKYSLLSERDKIIGNFIGQVEAKTAQGLYTKADRNWKTLITQ